MRRRRYARHACETRIRGPPVAATSARTIVIVAISLGMSLQWNSRGLRARDILFCKGIMRWADGNVERE
jgi:hypothetical protein